jgi:hypothetical protein
MVAPIGISPLGDYDRRESPIVDLDQIAAAGPAWRWAAARAAGAYFFFGV